MALDPQNTVDRIVLITERSSLLSHSLYDIYSRLVDSSIAPAITAVAQEFAELADLAKQFGEILTIITTSSHQFAIDQLLRFAGETLSRFELLIKAYETEISDFGLSHTPSRFKKIFKAENIRELALVCQSVKEPLRLKLSILRIVHENQERIKRSEEKNHPQDATALTRECELAGSWVEASRRVIKELLNAERRFQKRRSGDALQLRYWNESYGDTALWMYKLIFTRALKTISEADRSIARGHVNAMQPGATLDSKRDTTINNIPADLERELYVTGEMRVIVVKELLETWAGLEREQAGHIIDRQKTDSTISEDRNRIQASVLRIIGWYINNEKSLPGHESQSHTRPHSRGRSEKRKQYDTNTRDRTNGAREEETQKSSRAARGALPEVPSPPTPPTPPTIIPSHKPNGTKNSQEVIEKPRRSDSKKERELSAASKVAVLSRSASPEIIELPPSVYAQTRTEEHRKKDAPFTVTATDTTTKDGDRQFIFFINPRANEPEDDSNKKQVDPKETAVKTSNGRSQSSKQAWNQQTVSRVNFDIDDHFPQSRREEYPSSNGVVSEVRHRGRRRSFHETSNDAYTGVPRDDFYWNGSRYTPSTRRPTLPMFPETISAQGNNFPNTFRMGSHHHVPTPTTHTQPIPLQPPSGSGLSIRTYQNLRPQVSMNGYVPDPYEIRSVPEEVKNTKLVELEQRLQQRMDEYDKEESIREQARREEEEGRKERDRKRAKEDEKRFAAYNQKVEELQKVIQDLQESGRQNENKWEEEKASIERKLKEQAKHEEEAHKRTEGAAEMHATIQQDGGLWGFMANIQESERRKADEWAEQRDRIIEEAQEQLQQVAEDSEAEKQAAIEEIVSEYEEKLKTEQENVRKAEVKAEHYVTLYNNTFTAKYGEPRVDVSEGPPNPFIYMQRKQNLSSSPSANDDGASIDTQTETEHWEDRNPWVEGSPDDHLVMQDQARDNDTPVTGKFSDEPSYIIMFPPRAGWSEFGLNQLGNYLSKSGFKAMFEERERPTRDASGRFKKTKSGRNMLRGTLFWEPPASTAEADLYKSLRNCGWRPTYIRTTVSGQTWFFGAQPVHAQFFSDVYKPQVTPLDVSRTIRNSEKESLIISKDFIEVEELDFLGHIYKEQNGKIFLDPTLTPEDIDHIVARSFLAREGRYRKRFRNSSLRFSSPKMDIVEIASEAGDSASEASSGNKERRLNLWPFWGNWSG